jgi:hypothetical protein
MNDLPETLPLSAAAPQPLIHYLLYSFSDWNIVSGSIVSVKTDLGYHEAGAHLDISTVLAELFRPVPQEVIDTLPDWKQNILETHVNPIINLVGMAPGMEGY